MTDEVSVRSPTLDDVDALFAIYGDARTWRHLPQERFVERSRMERMVRRWLDEWADVGLSSWVVERDGDVVGSCGVMPRIGWWNLGFRFAPEVWGSGLATRFATQAVRGGREHRPTWPIVARSLANNPASGAVSEKAGLRLVWRGRVESSHASPQIDRVIHADRELDEDLLAAIVALG